MILFIYLYLKKTSGAVLETGHMWVQFLISGGAAGKSNLATGRGILGINGCHRCRPGMQGV